MSSRSRQRRKRFISGSTLDETTSCRAKKMHINTVHHSKSQCNEQHTSLPSSPNSPFLDSANMLFNNSDIGLGAYVNQKDIPVDRSDPVEDENSFSSSMFSEKLVQPELNLVAEPSSTNEHKSVNHKNSVSNKRLLSSHPNIILDTESDVNLDGMLIQGERMILSPTAAATDDAGSSEGEYENESRESTLHQTNSSVHHTTCRNMTSQPGVVSVPCSRTLELVESESRESMYSNSVKVSVFDTMSQPTECCSNRSGSLTTLNSTLNKPNGFVESSTSNCFVALVNCSPPLQILSNQKIHKTVSCHRATCFSESSVLLDTDNSEFRASSCNNRMTVTTCGSHCSHNCSDPSPHETDAESMKQSRQPQHDFHPTVNMDNFSREVQNDKALLNSESLSSPISLVSSNNKFLPDRYQLSKKHEALFTDHISSFPPGQVFIIIPNSSSEISPGFVKKCRDSESGFLDTHTSHSVNNVPGPEVQGHSYPLRSRLRQAFLRLQWQAMQVAPKSFGQLPTEVVFRIIHYLSIQDVFRLQRVNHRFKSIIEQYLLLVKRINFSNGLPFAFLPDSITDMALKRMLSRTPEVTHILGFYPRKILESYPPDGQYSSIGSGHNSLTYGGIITAFRLCPKLRSVELMDVELMSELVRHLPRIKFHGMFRNRPDSWDCEYAVPLPPEPNAEIISEASEHDHVTNSVNSRDESHVDSRPKPLFGNFISTLFCSATTASAVGSSRGKRRNSTRLKPKGQIGCGCTIQSLQFLNSSFSSSQCKNESIKSLTQMAIQLAHKIASRHASFANWFEPVGELPLGQGSPSTVPHFLPSRLFTAFNGGPSFPPAHENIQVNPAAPIAQDCYASALESLRNIAVSHFLQPGLPPIEAELIAVAPFGYSRCSLHGVGSGRNNVRNAHGPVLAFAFGAIFVPPQAVSPFILPPNNSSNCRFVDARQYNAVLLGANLLRGAHGPHLAFERVYNFPQNLNQVNIPRQQLHEQAGGRNQQRQQPQRFRRPRTNTTSFNASGPWLVSPLPNQLQWIILPHAITNLTKLDLVSVAISAIPRLDNIKYLHLKWVVFASADPFFSFLAPKLQSFVMNNCSTPSRVVRFVRIFSALSRAPQLTRLELVGTRFIDGLIGHIIDDTMSHGRGFRNLQRLVLSSNKDASEVDIGLLLLAGQQSLNQVALQMLHTRNSLFEGLYHAGVEFPRLESLTLGYLDPYQSRLTVSELMSLGIGESADHLSPICMITDWGIALAFFICPRLVNITIRNAPYLNDISRWFSAGFCNDESLHLRPTIIPSSSVNEDSSTQQSTPTDCQVDSTQSCASIDKLSKAYFLPLRSLTLENCPGISTGNLEHILNSGHPFPCLETVVLRNMFAAQYGENKDFISSYGNSCTSHSPIDNLHDETVNEQTIDWRKLTHLLSLSDLLSTRRLGYSPLSPEGIGLGASVREVIHINPPRGFLPDSLRTKPNDLFCSLRAHTYLNNILELDGSCGWSISSPSRVFKTLFSDNLQIPVSVNDPERCTTVLDNDNDDALMSRSTQTCICGMLEWEIMLRMSQPHLITGSQYSAVKSKPTSPGSSKNSQSCCSVRIDTETSRNSTTTPSSSHSGKTFLRSTIYPNNTSTSITPQLQLGGSLAFHPFPPSIQHKNLCRMITTSEWSQLFNKMSTTPFGLPPWWWQIVYPVTGSNECSGCASDPLLFSQGILDYQISAPCKLTKQSPSHSTSTTFATTTTTKWLAHDACIDTSELRCFTFPKPQILKIFQPLNAVHSCLTSLHFEKVGISHILLCEAPHLKNITLENCPELRAILFDNHSSSINCTNDQNINNDFTYKPINRFPALRRFRIINCPKFAIYNFLFDIGQLYPVHHENLSITYRPFGQYSTQVERALWDFCQHAHILISHDYKIWESERAMEEFHSTFDQLFREVINFSDMVIRRDLLPIYPQPTETLHNSVYKRCEHGFQWDFITDIPWVHEVCCSLLRNSELHRSDQADQLYELLSEYQAASENLKIQRHGIHFHVQFRNVHSHLDMRNNSNDSSSAMDIDDNDNNSIYNNNLNYFLQRKPLSYLNWPYSECNLLTTYPSNDLNTMKYLLEEKSSIDESSRVTNPLQTSQTTIHHDNIELLPWKQLLLSQEEILNTDLINLNKLHLSSFPNVISTFLKQNNLSTVIQSSSTSDNRSQKLFSSTATAITTTTNPSASSLSSSSFQQQCNNILNNQQLSSSSTTLYSSTSPTSTLCDHHSSRKRSLPPTKLLSKSCKKLKLKQ
ncbi:F-box only protein [Schistosoma japonicum]|uniref:F-box only protein n=1 Tax=Schistosoma japonicum TaxID=6182 RepID=A0A4Z2DSY5_SCHJA|nr:F-box only protein [Schistosoma japonicum]